jgi:hypothetical protein
MKCRNCTVDRGVIEAADAAMEFLPAWNQTSARQRMFPQDDRE